MKVLVLVASVLVLLAVAADARSLMQNTKCSANYGCTACNTRQKKCTACAVGFELDVSSGKCKCPQGSGTHVDPANPIEGWATEAPNCAEGGCTCSQCPEGYSTEEAEAPEDAMCGIPVDCAGDFQCNVACAVATGIRTFEISAPAQFGGAECAYEAGYEAGDTESCNGSTPTGNLCDEVNSYYCQADGSCAANV